MAEGLVTFFSFEQLGFYKRNTDGEEYSERLDMAEMLSDLKEWYGERVSLPDTLIWDAALPANKNRKKVYLKHIQKNEETGDCILILWRAVGGGDGVYGISADAALDDQTLYNANDAAGGDEVIWGEASYYWFIPEHDVFASIKFPRSISDSQALNYYLRDFVELQSTLRQRNVEEKETKEGIKYLSVSFSSDKTDANLWFRIRSRQYSKTTQEIDLEAMARDITHFVRREEISAFDNQEGGWEKYVAGLPFMSSKTTDKNRKVEVVIEAKPTVKELREMLEVYNDNYAGGIDPWVNVGFRKEGAGGTVWLNEFVVKNILVVSDLADNYDDSGHYSPRRLFAALHLRRDEFLAPIVRDDKDNADVAA